MLRLRRNGRKRDMRITEPGLRKIASFFKVVLLSFALISIGYMLGKNSQKTADSEGENAFTGDHIAVYYLHSTFRCETCNTIEAMTKDLLDRNYTTHLGDGRIRWKEIDFMKNIEMAEAFEIAASTVVVADVRDGEVLRYQRLDEVWTLTGDRKAFDSYLSTAIDLYLDGRANNE